MFKITPIALAVAAILALPLTTVAADAAQSEAELQQLQDRVRALEERLQQTGTAPTPATPNAAAGDAATRVMNPTPFNIGLSALISEFNLCSDATLSIFNCSKSFCNCSNSALLR